MVTFVAKVRKRVIRKRLLRALTYNYFGPKLWQSGNFAQSRTGRPLFSHKVRTEPHSYIFTVRNKGPHVHMGRPQAEHSEYHFLCASMNILTTWCPLIHICDYISVCHQIQQYKYQI